MRKRLCDPAQVDLIYDLSAILIHKGTAVNSGHYIAHIRDEKRGQWWEFDDEHVSNLGDHPFGEDSSGHKSKPSQKEPLVHSLPVYADATDVLPQMCCHILQKMVIQNILRSFHLLMHTCLCTICGKPMCISGRHPWFWMPIIQMPDSTSNDITSLPSYLRDEVDELNASYVEACHQYKLWKETTLHLIEERRQGVRLILSEAPVQSFEESFYWISANWLRLWVDNIMPPMVGGQHWPRMTTAWTA